MRPPYVWTPRPGAGAEAATSSGRGNGDPASEHPPYPSGGPYVQPGTPESNRTPGDHASRAHATGSQFAAAAPTQPVEAFGRVPSDQRLRIDGPHDYLPGRHAGAALS